jgi:hypothetical protein
MWLEAARHGDSIKTVDEIWKMAIKLEQTIET